MHQWPKYWSFSFSVSPSSEYSGLISFGLTGLISLLSKEFSRVFSTIQKHQFFGAQPWKIRKLTLIQFHCRPGLRFTKYPNPGPLTHSGSHGASGGPSQFSSPSTTSVLWMHKGQFFHLPLSLVCLVFASQWVQAVHPGWTSTDGMLCSQSL